MDEKNIKQDSWQAWLLAARPKTLTGAMVVQHGGSYSLRPLCYDHADRCELHQRLLRLCEGK